MKILNQILILILFECYFIYCLVIGIDFGSESFKVSLVKPKLFDVILNEQSNRKTPSVVAFDQDEILFGTEAKNLVNNILFYKINFYF